MKAALMLNLAEVLSRAIYMQKYSLNPYRYLLHFELVQTSLSVGLHFAHPFILVIHVHGHRSKSVKYGYCMAPHPPEKKKRRE